MAALWIQSVGLPASALSSELSLRPAPAGSPAEPGPAPDPVQLLNELKRLQQEISRRARPVTLREAISLSLQNNPQLTQAFSVIQQYEWQLIAAQRRWYPTAQLSNGNPFVGYQWQTFVTNNYGASVEQLDVLQQPRQVALNSRFAKFVPGATVNWNFVEPTRQSAINASVESLRQQKYLFDVSARNLILSTQQAYFSIQSSQQLIDSFQQIFEINEKQLQIIEAQRSIGMVTVLDVQQTRSQLYQQLSLLVQYIQNYIEQTAALAAELALPDQALAIPSEPARLYGDWSLGLQATIEKANTNREEILASLAAAQAANWSAVTAIRTYLPVFSIYANGSLTGINGYQNVPVSLSGNDRAVYQRTWDGSVGLGFRWSLFDGGIEAANSQSFKAQARQQQAFAAATELQVTQQVRSSYSQKQTSYVAVLSAQQAYASAQVAQEASRARFAVGVGDITSVVQTIQQLSSAATQLATAMLSYNNAIADLYRYSATWPEETEAELDQRLQRLRVSPEATKEVVAP